MKMHKDEVMRNMERLSIKRFAPSISRLPSHYNELDEPMWTLVLQGELQREKMIQYNNLKI